MVLALTALGLFLTVLTRGGDAFTRDGCCQEAGQCPPRTASRFVFALPNRRLVGQTYRGGGLQLPATSQVRCASACLADPGCVSFQHWQRERLCELNGATALRLPQNLTESPGATYYGPDKPLLVEDLYQIVASGVQGRGPPGVTDCLHHTIEPASADCQRTGQHLCELWELEQVYRAGYDATLPAEVSLWYAVADSQAVLPVHEAGNGTGEVRQHGLPTVVPAPGVCCRGLPLEPQDPVISALAYANTDRDGMAQGCAQVSAHPCTLAELKAAYRRGYRYGSWRCLAVPGRDATVLGGCAGGSECYEGTIANTPRPSANCQVFCCKDLY